MKRRLLILVLIVAAIGLAGAGGWYYLRKVDPMSRALQYEASGNLRAAQVELRNAIRLQPRNADAHLQMAKLQMKLADPVAAEVEFRAARAVGADPWVVLPLLGEAMIAQGQNREVLTVVPPRGPTPAIAARNLLMRSVAQLALGDIKAAEETQALTEKAAPGSVEAMLIAARLAAAHDDFAATAAKVDEVLKLDPTQIDALLMKEQLVASKGDHEAALALADRAVNAAPWSAMAHMRRANQYMFVNQDAKAQQDADAVLSVQPRFIEAVYIRALIMARAGKYQDAAAEMERLNASASMVPQALYYQSLLASTLGRTETAVDYARRYNNLVPTDADGVKQLARLELATKRPDQALALLEKAVAAGQKDAATLDLLGNAYALLGSTSKAVSNFQQAVALAPDDPAILAHYGMAQAESGRSAAALPILQRSIELSPVTNPTAGEALVSAYLATGNLDAADKALAGLKAKVGDTEGVGVLAGTIKLRRNDVDGAKAIFADTLKRFPGSTLAKLNLARVLVSQGQRADGLAMMAEILAKQPAQTATLDIYVPLLLSDKQFPAAVQALEAARAANPTQLGFAVMLTDVLSIMGNHPRAIATAKAALGAPPVPPPLLAALARAYIADGKIAEARTTYADMLKEHPEDLVIRSELLALMLRDQDTAGARALLKDGLASSPGNFRIMTDMVLLEASAGGLDQGIAMAEQLRRDPADMPGAALLKGDAFSRAGRDKEAAAAFQAEFAAAPSGPLLMRLARAQANSGQQDAASQVLRDWLDKTPDTPDAAQALAQLDIAAKRFGDAEKNLNLVLKSRPDDPLALNNLAWVYDMTGDKRARATAQRAYLQSPTPDAADTLGWIMLRAGDVKAALPLLQRSSTQRPRDPAAQYHFAAALKEDGQTDAAAKLLLPLVTGNQAFDEKPAARQLLEQIGPRTP